MKTTLIRGGTVVLGQSVALRDILIHGETIAAVGQLSQVRADKTVDAGGLLVLPGGVDTHVHFNDEFMNTVSVHDYYTGTRAAAFGGATSVIDFSNQAPGATLMSTIENKHAEAQGRALIDWGVHPTITQHGNGGDLERSIAQIPAVVAAGSPTVKVYMTYRNEGLLMEEPELRRILAGLEFDLIVMDVRLPGDAAITDLRRQAAFGEPKVLAISAQVFPGAASMAHQLGFDAFLGIPFSDRQLLDVIGSLLGLRFEPRGEQRDAPVTARPHWPVVLAQETALRIREAIDMGDVANLFQLADELADNPDAPRADVDNMALMARLFDFDGLRQLCNRLQATDAPA